MGLISEVAVMAMTLMTIMMAMMVMMLMQVFMLAPTDIMTVMIITMLLIIIFFLMRKELIEMPHVCVFQFNSSLILVDSPDHNHF